MSNDGDASEQPQERSLATPVKRYTPFERRRVIAPVGDGFLPPYSTRDDNGDPEGSQTNE